MSINSNFSQSSFQKISSSFSLGKSLKASDNSFATANFLGTIRPGRLPVRFRASGTLNRNDRVDFFRYDFAPGASINNQVETGSLKGGRIKAISYVAVPGQAPRQFQALTYAPGRLREKYDTPVTNNFGTTIQIYIAVRSLNRNARIGYSYTVTFQ